MTLFTTPVVYLFCDGVRGRFAKPKRKPMMVVTPEVEEEVGVAGD
jgi:hypothetical protein